MQLEATMSTVEFAIQHRTPTLAETIEWACGKTVHNFDHKDIPLETTARIIKEHGMHPYCDGSRAFA